MEKENSIRNSLRFMNEMEILLNHEKDEVRTSYNELTPEEQGKFLASILEMQKYLNEEVADFQEFVSNEEKPDQ